MDMDKKDLAKILNAHNAKIVPSEELTEDWLKGYEDGFNAGRLFADIMPPEAGYVSFSEQ